MAKKDHMIYFFSRGYIIPQVPTKIWQPSKSVSEYRVDVRVMNPFLYFADKGTAQPAGPREKFRI